ncbi:MAG: UDP-N-acetylmuramate dehydrogenase [Acidobacteriota bacterium]|nr:UDP-N-acetylmuramate dehydrogenase [Acidobacteriota bacterium]MDH3784562.1 UDP-N-acetylmuramate dehydrogenase [Acidobacteriota bacterium]
MPDRTDNWLTTLRNTEYRGKLEIDRPLAPLTTLRVGGAAELLATPATIEDLAILLSWARDEAVPWKVLGNGSNLVVRDRGVRGLVIRVRRVLDTISIDGNDVIAGGGASFPALAKRSAAAGLAGLEFAAGIPGTLGGAVTMNAGWHEFEIGNHVVEVDWVDGNGRRRQVPHDECGFRYRGSLFRDNDGIVVGARLKLADGDPDEIASRLERFAGSRKENQPTELPSCGSVFLKPDGDYAGRLIEEAGLKEYRIGDAEVSALHANFFVNRGAATAADVLRLVDHVETVVKEKFGVTLVREFELW